VRFPRKLAGLLVAAGMAASATAAAAPARASTIYYVFGTTAANTSADTGLCLEADPGPDFAYRVETQPCNLQNPAQQWTAVAQGGGISKLVNHAVGWCLDAHVPTPNLVNAPVILWDCSATMSDENWQLVISPQSYGFIESRAWNTSGYSVSIPGGQRLPGLWTQLQADTNAPDGSQLLRIFTVSSGGSDGSGGGGGGGCATATPPVSGQRAVRTPDIIVCP
jgi:hypothetical protein